jgi:hypothetical protein
MCSENQEPKNRRWLATSLEVEVFDVDPKKPALTFWVSCNPRPRMETSGVPNRDSVCSPKAKGLMVLPGIGATREWNKVSGEYLTARTGRNLCPPAIAGGKNSHLVLNFRVIGYG